jgi:hypothetical protein
VEDEATHRQCLTRQEHETLHITGHAFHELGNIREERRALFRSGLTVGTGPLRRDVSPTKAHFPFFATLRLAERRPALDPPVFPPLTALVANRPFRVLGRICGAVLRDNRCPRPPTPGFAVPFPFDSAGDGTLFRLSCSLGSGK